VSLLAATGVFAFGATITFSVPMVPVVVTLAAWRPRLWAAVALTAALGSAVAGGVFIHYLGHWGNDYLQSQWPALAGSAHWQHLLDWTDAYGAAVLTVYAVSPLPQLPALAAFALLGLGGAPGAIALLVGKAVKYLVMARLAAGGTQWAAPYLSTWRTRPPPPPGAAPDVERR
jgi:membrane protein YqaA with SNARE-associated domain